ncbi:MAG TPA: MotA/TolQ/ExbB proton channel family protein [Candidatus Polarisedimenticolia bacterium]|jgi:biopolymer transport protein TolQ|nr:MotA/TolQ/ExbB proton channel family protein [Candidatus Polarisedimenticolia bacterium]
MPLMIPVPLAAAATTPGLHADPLRLITESGWVAQGVLLTLLAFSVMSWAVMLERWRFLKRAEAESRRLLADLQGDKRLSDMYDRAARHTASPLAPILQAGFRELIAAVNEGVGGARGAAPTEEGRQRVMNRLRRRVDEAAGMEADTLDRNLGLLATTGSVAPFIGLFGTVWGIMDAFQGIGLTGSASLAAVAPGISEALVTTAAGLAAAIPAVCGYNLLLARARRLGARIDRFVPQFLSQAESQLDAARPAAAAAEAGKFRI